MQRTSGRPVIPLSRRPDSAAGPYPVLWRVLFVEVRLLAPADGPSGLCRVPRGAGDYLYAHAPRIQHRQTPTDIIHLTAYLMSRSHQGESQNEPGCR